MLTLINRPRPHKRSISHNARKSVNLSTIHFVDTKETNRGVEAKQFRESLRKSSLNRSVSATRDIPRHDRGDLSPAPLVHASTTKNIPNFIKTSLNQLPIQSIGKSTSWFSKLNGCISYSWFGTRIIHNLVKILTWYRSDNTWETSASPKSIWEIFGPHFPTFNQNELWPSTTTNEKNTEEHEREGKEKERDSGIMLEIPQIFQW